VLARLIAPDERVVTIEDQSELHLWRDLHDCISLEGRPPNTEGRGAITIQMLVHEALRMSPDRIIIGEVRGGEALDLLDAMNTGHAVVTWLSPVGNRIDECGDLFQMVRYVVSVRVRAAGSNA